MARQLGCQLPSVDVIGFRKSEESFRLCWGSNLDLDDDDDDDDDSDDATTPVIRHSPYRI